jgi:hypothetical protein
VGHRFSPGTELFPKAELLDEAFVTADVFSLDIFEEPFPLTDHLHQTGPGMVILLVGGEMLDKEVDPFGQQGDLDLRGARILGVSLVLLDDLRFVFFA